MCWWIEPLFGSGFLDHFSWSPTKMCCILWAVDGDIVQILSNTSAAQQRRREIKWDSKEELFWWSHKGHDGTIPFIFIWSLLFHLNTLLLMAAVDFRKRDTIILKTDRSYPRINYIFRHFKASPSYSYKSQRSGVEINICVIFVWLAARNTVKF